ncbi:ribonuclease H-like domain-containing protein [Tanacetum coccineum]
MSLDNLSHMQPLVAHLDSLSQPNMTAGPVFITVGSASHVGQLGQKTSLWQLGSTLAGHETVLPNAFNAMTLQDHDTEGVDETFSLVVKQGIIRTVLSLATSQHWPVHQLDVKNAFLHGDLSETYYMHHPLCFRNSAHPVYGTDTTYLLLYVDDIVLTASYEILLQQIIASLHQEFSMTDLGPLNYFLGIFVTCDSSGKFLS